MMQPLDDAFGEALDDYKAHIGQIGYDTHERILMLIAFEAGWTQRGEHNVPA